nr:HepT-like ribonuclease domain-containing protein [Methanofollis sp. W23]
MNGLFWSIEVTGEVAKHLPRSYPEGLWRSMVGMRDCLIHAYFRVDLKIVRDVRVHEIPAQKPLVCDRLNRCVEEEDSRR